VKENTDGAAKPSHNFDMDRGMFGSYVKFQPEAVYRARIDYLKAGQFEEPSVAGQEMCVPPLLLKFSSKVKVNSPQPIGIFSARGSCAFGPARIAAYEAAVLQRMKPPVIRSFPSPDMQLSGPSSIPKLRALIEYDIIMIAYLHLRKIKWKPKTAAHLAGKQAPDDDDAAPAVAAAAAAPGSPNTKTLDFQKWSVTAMDEIPWTELHFSLTNSDTMCDGDVPPYFLPALLIVCYAKYMAAKQEIEISTEMAEFYKDSRYQVVDTGNWTMAEFLNLGEESRPPTNRWQRMLRSRDYTPQELEYVCVLWKMVNEEFLANKAKARAEEDEGQDQEPAVERERESEDDAAGSTPAVSNRLRSAVPKEPSDPRPAPKPAAKTPPAPAAAPSRSTPASGRKRARFMKTVASPATPEPTVRSDRSVKRRRQSSEHDEVAPIDTSIPKSDVTGRILSGQLSLNHRFPKGYSSPDAPKQPPVVGMPLSQCWHAVSCPFYSLIPPPGSMGNCKNGSNMK
jgi:hypothetical protein